jgi:hypothetical protein
VQYGIYGVYLALIYLRTIEKNPGPPGFDDNQKKFLDEMCAKLNQEITANVANIVTAQLAPVIKRIDHNEKELKELRQETLNSAHSYHPIGK